MADRVRKRNVITELILGGNLFLQTGIQWITGSGLTEFHFRGVSCFYGQADSVHKGNAQKQFGGNFFSQPGIQWITWSGLTQVNFGGKLFCNRADSVNKRMRRAHIEDNLFLQPDIQWLAGSGLTGVYFRGKLCFFSVWQEQGP